VKAAAATAARAEAAPSRALRVLTVFARFEVGGAEEVFLRSLPHLRRAGVAPGVLCVDAPGPLAPEAEAAGVPVGSLGRAGRRNDLGGVAALAAAFRAARPDVVQVHTYSRARLYTTLAAVVARVPALVAVATGCSGPASLKTRLCDALLLRRARRIVAHSEAIRAAVLRDRRVPPARVAVVRPGVDPERFAAEDPAAARAALRGELGLPAAARLVGSVARLDPVKGLDRLLAAGAAVAAARPDVHLVLAGDGPDGARLRALASGPALAGRVHFLGLRRDVPRVLAALDVFALPSLAEGYGLAALEALAAGAAVVASRAGGVPEVVADGRTGLLVEPGDAAGLAAALGRLLDDAALRARLGAAGRAEVRAERTMAGHAAALAAVYAAAAAPAGRGAAG
jgi:glycosyltransferase involved in cell wall biosynthesis